MGLRSSHLCHPGGRSINESSLWKLEASVWNSFIAIPEQLRKMLKGKIRGTLDNLCSSKLPQELR